MPASPRSTFVRARNPEQIEQRKAAILTAAMEVMEELGLERVTLADIAARAGTVKSNLYRYFESREHIYLLVLQRLGAEWEAWVIRALARLRGQGTVPQVAKVVTEAFARARDYSKMISVFNPILERTLTPELAVNFRSHFLARRQRFAAALTGALPGLSEPAAQALTLPVYCQIAGLWPFCQVSAEVRTHLSKTEHRHLQIRFETEMRQFLETLLAGAVGEARPPREKVRR